MIIVTGGAGFIGSALMWKLNSEGIKDIVVVDRLGSEHKWKNLAKRDFSDIVHKDHFLGHLTQGVKAQSIEAIFHMGACSSTTELDMDFLVENNLHYSMHLWDFATKHKIPFIYASSAATYGDGELGFVDDLKTITSLRPINKYGYSKFLFDRWVLQQKTKPPFWAGLKFFNVYGPNEYHKASQASVVYAAFPQVSQKKELKLFKSYRPEIKNGEQKRDFVYVKDVTEVLFHLYRARDIAVSGIYNVGSGTARTFADLGRAVFRAMDQRKENFNWVEMPDSLKEQYQYFTEADVKNLRQKTGFKTRFSTLEEGVGDYVKNYLTQKDPYL